MTSLPLPVFWPLNIQNKDIDFKFCVRVVRMCVVNIYSDFLHIGNFELYRFFEKNELLILGGQNRKMP